MRWSHKAKSWSVILILWLINFDRYGLALLGLLCGCHVSSLPSRNFIRYTCSWLSICLPRAERLSFVDFMTEVKSHSACLGYSSITLLMSLLRCLYTSGLLIPTRETICGKAVYHFKHVSTLAWLFSELLHLIRRRFFNNFGSSFIQSFKLFSFVSFFIFREVQPNGKNSRDSLVDVFWSHFDRLPVRLDCVMIHFQTPERSESTDNER